MTQNVAGAGPAKVTGTGRVLRPDGTVRCEFELKAETDLTEEQVRKVLSTGEEKDDGDNS